MQNIYARVDLTHLSVLIGFCMDLMVRSLNGAAAGPFSRVSNLADSSQSCRYEHHTCLSGQEVAHLLIADFSC
jgi:hypothetical protein